eukprot:scaffold327_cov257-Pinguiococcus_pyrenoidosus.AAC.9
MDQMITRLRRTVPSANNEWDNLVGRLHSTTQLMVRNLNEHLDKEEQSALPLVKRLLTDREIEALVGDIMGKRSTLTMTMLLRMVVRNLPPDEQRNMMKHLKHAAEGTFFERWLKHGGFVFEKGGLGSPLSEEAKGETSQAEAQCLKPSPSNVGVFTGCFCYSSCPACSAAGKAAAEADDAKAEEPSDAAVESRIAAQEKEGAAPGVTCIVCSAMDGCPAQVCTSEERRTKAQMKLIREMRAKRYDAKTMTELLQKLHGSRWMGMGGRSRAKSVDMTPAEASPRPTKKRKVEAGLAKVFSGFGSTATDLGCCHYKRKVKLLAPCCDKLFTCRLCHDQASDHMMDRFAVKEMVCMVCGTQQPVKGVCANKDCVHSSFSNPLSTYYCDVCHLFDDDPKKHIYHCPYCNVCRAGRGLGIDYRHCMRCNACVRIDAEHKCLNQVLQGNCPICLEEVFRSTRSIKALRCGHVMHKDCYTRYRQHSYTCPICWKSVDDMSEYFAQLDSYVSNLPMPAEYLNFRSQILCQDCGVKSWVRYHFAYHKCPTCSSFNTRLLEKVEGAGDQVV